MNTTTLIKKHEGTGPMERGNFMPYKDSEGLLTIGYGICIELTGLRENEAEFILRNRINETETECMLKLPWFNDMDDVRQSAIVNMVYNIGMPRFSGFRKTIGYLTAKDYASASVEMLDSKWARQVGSRANELSEMIRTAQWPD